ncbi:MAG: hypothetical protein R3F07_15180 [Opitutaceae bacterium]
MKEFLKNFSLRPAFMARSRREKVLAVLFLLVMAAIWFSSFSGRVKAVREESRTLFANKEVQDAWLKDRKTIDSNYQASLSRLNEAKLPTRNEFAGQIDTMLRKYQFGFRVDPPQTKARNTISEHTVTVSIEKANLAPLIEFTREIKEQFPYVGLEQLTLIPDRRNPALIDARLRLVAIEFNR